MRGVPVRPSRRRACERRVRVGRAPDRLHCIDPVHCRAKIEAGEALASEARLVGVLADRRRADGEWSLEERLCALETGDPGRPTVQSPVRARPSATPWNREPCADGRRELRRLPP